MPIGRKQCHAAQLTLLLDAPAEFPELQDAEPNAHGVLRGAHVSRVWLLEEAKAGRRAYLSYTQKGLRLGFYRHRGAWHWSYWFDVGDLSWGGAAALGKRSHASFSEAAESATAWAVARIEESKMHCGLHGEGRSRLRKINKLLGMIERGEYQEHIRASE